jgi:hypothetical protein
VLQIGKAKDLSAPLRNIEIGGTYIYHRAVKCQRVDVSEKELQASESDDGLPITVQPVCHATAAVPMLEQCAGADHPNYTRIKGSTTEPSGTKRGTRQKPHALSDNKHCSRLRAALPFCRRPASREWRQTGFQRSVS